jgi:hypothetical protein
MSSRVTLLHNGDHDHRSIVAFGTRISMVALAALVCAIVFVLLVVQAAAGQSLDLIRLS